MKWYVKWNFLSYDTTEAENARVIYSIMPMLESLFLIVLMSDLQYFKANTSGDVRVTACFKSEHSNA